MDSQILHPEIDGDAIRTASGSALLLFFAPAGGLHVLERGWRRLPDGGRLTWQRSSSPGGVGMQTHALALGSAVSSMLAALTPLPAAAPPGEARLPRPLRWGVGWQDPHTLPAGRTIWDGAHQADAQEEADYAFLDDATTYYTSEEDHVLLPLDGAGAAAATRERHWAAAAALTGGRGQQEHRQRLGRQRWLATQRVQTSVLPDVDAALLVLLVAATAGVFLSLVRCLLQLREAALEMAAAAGTSSDGLCAPLLLLQEGSGASPASVLQRFYNPLHGPPKGT